MDQTWKYISNHFSYQLIQESQMQSTEEKIKNLNQAIHKDDHNEVYQYSKMLLKESPDDLEYQQCFIISALRISLADELGQNVFKSAPNNAALQNLYAYYLYNEGEYDRSIQYIQSTTMTLELKLLLAQNYFKTQLYSKSAEIMISLLKEVKLQKDDREEYLANLLATGLNSTLSLEQVKEYEKFLVKVERKELFYNYALLMYEAQEYTKCLNYLNEFSVSLMEGSDTNDIITVKLFQHFLEWKTQKHISKDHVQLYEQYKKDASDLNIKGVINNNLLFFTNSGIQNTHETLKMLDESLESQYKMSKAQSLVINLNKLTVLLRKNRLPEAVRVLKEIQSLQTKELLLTNVQYVKNKYFLLKKNKDFQEVHHLISLVTAKNADLGFCLKADFAKERNVETELLNEIKNNENSNPLIKNYIFSLLIKHPTLFDQYSDYLCKLVEITNDHNVLQILLNVYQNKNDILQQKNILQKMLKGQPKNQLLKIKFAKILLQEGLVQETEDILRGVEGPEEINDITYLQFIEKNIHISIKKETEDLPKNQTEIKKNAKKKIKKNKKSKLPKNIEKFIEGFKGDPERWLPKWQRKNYKKKGGKKGGKTQGLATVGKQETKNVFKTGASTSAQEVTKNAQKKRK